VNVTFANKADTFLPLHAELIKTDIVFYHHYDSITFGMTKTDIVFYHHYDSITFGMTFNMIN